MIQQIVRTVVIGDANVEALIGEKFYPMRLPEKETLPAATYRVVSGDPDTTLEGDSFEDAVRIQVTSWGDKYDDAQAVFNAIRQAIKGSSAIKARSLLYLDIEDPDTRAYGVVYDFVVWATIEALTPPVLNYFLLETGDSFLLETGDKLALED